MSATAPAEQSVTKGDILVAHGITKRFGGLVAVDNVDMTVPRGSIAGLIGPNGAGKTTFFNMIAGIYEPTEGSISFDGSPIVGQGRPLRPDQVTKLGIARTFQNIRLFANMTAIENVLIGMHCRLNSTPLGAALRLGSFKREETDAYLRAQELLTYVGLRGQARVTSKNLSYGDQRRLEIARALASQPKLLLLDEPTAGMNPQETAQLTRFIDRLRHDLDVTVLLIEHDMKVVMGISDQVSVLDHGLKISEGTPAQVQRDSKVIEAYLGTDAGAVAEAEGTGAHIEVDDVLQQMAESDAASHVQPEPRQGQ